jgi:hypothetical protein
MTWRWVSVVLVACTGGGGSFQPPPAAPRLTLSTTELHLAAPVGVTVTATITATNENAERASAVPALDDFTPPQFAIVDTDCPDVLAPAASCMVTVAFTPDRVGVVLGDAVLEIGNSRAALVGNGEVAVTISPDTHDFGSIFIDKNSAAFAFEVQNTTAVAQHPTTTIDNPLEWGFEILGTTCGDLPPLGSCKVSVRLLGGTVGPRSATLDVGGAQATVSGIVSNVASPQLYHYGTGFFGNVGIYAMSTTVLVQIVNGTHADLAKIDTTIEGSGAAAFPIVSNSCANPVADGASCFLEIRASSTVPGTADAELIARAPGVPDLAMPLSASFFDDGPRLAIAPSGVVAFAPDQQITFTITNASAHLRYIDSITVAAPYQFGINTCSGNVVASATSCSFTLKRLASSGANANQLLTVAWDEGQQETVTLVPAN